MGYRGYGVHVTMGYRNIWGIGDYGVQGLCDTGDYRGYGVKGAMGYK